MSDFNNIRHSPTLMRLTSGTLWPMPLPRLPLLSHIEPPALRRKAAVDGLVTKATMHHTWPLNNYLLNPHQHRLTSHMPLWSDMELMDIISQWHNDWSSASMVSCDIVQDPTIHRPGFDLPRKQWCTLNRSEQTKVTVVPATCSGGCLMATYVHVVPSRQCPT